MKAYIYHQDCLFCFQGWKSQAIWSSHSRVHVWSPFIHSRQALSFIPIHPHYLISSRVCSSLMPEWRMSKCLARLFHYVIIQYILFPELRKYISFTLAHYSLGNCFSSIILTTWILTDPDSLDQAPAVSANTSFPGDVALPVIYRVLPREYLLPGTFLTSARGGLVSGPDPEGLQKTAFPSALQQGVVLIAGSWRSL